MRENSEMKEKSQEFNVMVELDINFHSFRFVWSKKGGKDGFDWIQVIIINNKENFDEN